MAVSRLLKRTVYGFRFDRSDRLAANTESMKRARKHFIEINKKIDNNLKYLKRNRVEKAQFWSGKYCCNNATLNGEVGQVIGTDDLSRFYGYE
jgi:hypothetical protein